MTRNIPENKEKDFKENFVLIDFYFFEVSFAWFSTKTFGLFFLSFNFDMPNSALNLFHQLLFRRCFVDENFSRFFAVLIFDKFRQFWKFFFFDCLLNCGEKLSVVIKIMDRKQQRSEKLVGFQQMMRVSSRVVSASDALTTFHVRLEVFFEFFV